MPTNFPTWKYCLLGITLILGFIYAIPNLYGEDPAVQISGIKGQVVTQETLESVNALLTDAGFQAKSVALEGQNTLLARFSNAETQLKAKEVIRNGLDDDFSVALNLAPVTPRWLQALGAKPMKLGLDLMGGIHFLMEVDVDSVIARRMEAYYSETPKMLRNAKIRYTKIDREDPQTFLITFSSLEDKNAASALLQKEERDLSFASAEEDKPFSVRVKILPATLQNIRQETLEQTLTTLRNRVNELGVAEAIVQRQGQNRVVVELPGIQDTAYARDILGKTATLKFLMEDSQHSIQDVMNGHPAIGSKIYYDRFKRPTLLKMQPILTGEAITGASTGQDRDGAPAVNVRLTGDIAFFSKTTRESIGQRMGVVYVEVKDNKTTESLISIAKINSALGNQFQIVGFTMPEARDLALLLRAGALPAPTSIVEESIVGPSMGQENIRMGMISIAVGLGLVLFFMAIYYSVFGLIANLALIANLILLVALVSLIGATLTLPAIAGMVLTLGMAVDANVLIFERIREEIRLGVSPKASIHRGYEFAFATIIDSNLTTLIVGVILFAIGTGPVKGFAVTLCLGILTSLLTALTFSRAIVELIYGGRSLKQVRVGI